LLRTSIPFFQKYLHWILGNGKSINHWKDKILNQNPLEEKEKYIGLRGWLEIHQKSTLFDISDWNDDGSWKKWKLGEVPRHLQIQSLSLINDLKWVAPIHRITQNNRGWGPNGYSVKEGYQALLFQANLPGKSNWW
jgi:hypothetical protein